MNEICETHSDAEVRETLKNLPEDLSATYQRLLSKICRSPKKVSVAQTVFKWVACAKRPLQVDELKEAAAFSPDDTAWDEDKVLDEELMLESCRGLVTKDEVDRTVRFAHHTVQQHLTTSKTDVHNNLFKIDIAEAEVLAGRLCVGYLLFSDFETQMTRGTPKFRPTGVFAPGGPLQLPTSLGIDKTLVDLPYKFHKRTPGIESANCDHTKYVQSKFGAKDVLPTSLKDKYHFLSYAIEYWEPHTRWYPTVTEEFRRPLRHLVLEKDLAFNFRPWGPNQHTGPFGCTACPNLNGSVPSEKSRELPLASLIHYALEVGNPALIMIVPMLEKYLEQEEEILAIACKYGRTQMVKALLEGRNVDQINKDIIEIAAELGHLELLRYLLQFPGCAVQKHDTDALCLAACNGSLAIIESLFECGVDLNAEISLEKLPLCIPSPLERKALNIAASGGHANTVRLLLDKGAKITERALQCASREGHVPVVEMLLHYGASPNTFDCKGSPMHAAAAKGHSSVIRLLLQYGANAQMFSQFQYRPEFTSHSSERFPHRDEIVDYGTSFHVAASSGHVPVLEVLKSEFTSVDDRLTDKHRTALHFAARNGHLSAVRWLIQNGANANAQDYNNLNCLSFAAKGRQTNVVRYLLDVADTSCVISSINSLPDHSNKKIDRNIRKLLSQRLCNDREATVIGARG